MLHRQPKIKRYVSAFISHKSDDNVEAKYYRNLLLTNGFTAWEYGGDSMPGCEICEFQETHIRDCHFFILLISDNSLKSEPVQRELGFALDLQRSRLGYRPLIIPLLCENLKFRKEGKACPDEFPVRHHVTGQFLEPLKLKDGVRALDKHANPIADADDVLLEVMTPRFWISKEDFSHTEFLKEMQVFDLYEQLFPDDDERNSQEEIIEWLTEPDSTQETVQIGTEVTFKYMVDTRFFVLTVANRAVGFASFDYEHESRFVFGNYIGVQGLWRAGGFAQEFMELIRGAWKTTMPFSESLGLVFEVEPFNERELAEIIERLENSERRSMCSHERNVVQRFLRISWYQLTQRCRFFMDATTQMPLACTSPCLNTQLSPGEWPKHELQYWLMWRPLTDDVHIPDIADLWRKAVHFVYIEVIAKSLVRSNSTDIAGAYWQYANSVVRQNLKAVDERQICLGPFMRRDPKRLWARWIALNIDLPI